MTIALGDEVEVPHRPDVPGLRFRRFRGRADFPGMAAANQAHRDSAGVEEAITAGLNPNQAMTLYSSLGFEESSLSIDWTKPLPAWTGVAAPPETP